MKIEAIDLPARGVEDLRKVLNGLEVKLSDAKAQRDRILIDMRKASAAVDMGDQRARFAQGSLNKEDASAGRLILSIQAQIAEARKRLEPVSKGYCTRDGCMIHGIICNWCGDSRCGRKSSERSIGVTRIAIRAI